MYKINILADLYDALQSSQYFDDINDCLRMVSFSSTQYTFEVLNYPRLTAWILQTNILTDAQKFEYMSLFNPLYAVTK